MAELAAHLATATSDLPSIFEIIAQENLASTLRPAFAYVAKILAEKFPSKVGFLYRIKDEAFTVLDLFLEHYFLKTKGASFAEDFYGLRRSISTSNFIPKISNYALPFRTHIKALFCLVIVPYIKLRIERIIEKYELESSESLHRTAKLLTTFLKFVMFIWETLVFVYLIRYAVGKGIYATPLLHFTKTCLETLTESEDEDSLNQEKQGEKGSAVNWFGKYLMTGFSIGTFFLQFIEWWYSSGNTTKAVSGVASNFAPPDAHNPDIKPGICPLCSNPLKNPIVLATSGYVFCYICIHNSLKDNQFCPVTGLPTSSSQLIRIYSE